MQIIKETNIELIKKLLKRVDKPILINANTIDFNRKMLEYGKFDSLLLKKESEIELNEIIARIASKNNISICIDLNEIRDSKKNEKAIFLKKIIKNIQIMRKAKTKIALLNAGSKRESLELLLSLGASTQQAAEAIYF